MTETADPVPVGGSPSAARRGWGQHPPQLFRLAITEMWERFGYYGMRALLTLYLSQHFLFGDDATISLYGGFTALVYLTPLIGGLAADRVLGSKRAVKFGAILMALGYFTLCFGGQPAKPYIEIEGSRAPITVVKQDGASRQIVHVGDRDLELRGNADGSMALVRADGAVDRKLAPGTFETGGERSRFAVILMLLALSMVCVGNGFFKPNISSVVGTLYAPGDTRRDAGFTLFYMGINFGALMAQLLCPVVAGLFGWPAGFFVAGLGMLISWMVIHLDRGSLRGYGDPPPEARHALQYAIYAGAVVAVPVLCFLLVNLLQSSHTGSGHAGQPGGTPIMPVLLFFAFPVSVAAILIWARKVGTVVETQMMASAFILMLFNVVFWTLLEQAGSSLTLFAARNTNLSIFGLFSLAPGQIQFLNPFFLVLLAPLFSILWRVLAARNAEPSVPIKFAFALAGAGSGFLILVLGTHFVGPDFKIGLWWLALLYLAHSAAELCIAPVGLSMITKLSIPRVVGLMMGVWFLSISVGQFIAGLVARSAGVETVGGQVMNLGLSLKIYSTVFEHVGWSSVAAAILLVVIARPLRRWMHGVT